MLARQHQDVSSHFLGSGDPQKRPSFATTTKGDNPTYGEKLPSPPIRPNKNPLVPGGGTRSFGWGGVARIFLDFVIESSFFRCESGKNKKILLLKVKSNSHVLSWGCFSHVFRRALHVGCLNKIPTGTAPPFGGKK